MRIKNVKIHSGTTGVYKLIFKGSVVYVGQSVDVRRRINVHVSKFNFDRFEVIECKNEELDAIEAALIAVYNPPKNKKKGENYKVTTSASRQADNAIVGTNGSVINQIDCMYCGTSFYPRTTWAKFCCDTCRVASWSRRKALAIKAHQ